MTQASEGSTVAVHYTGTLDDGTVFDTSKDSDPLTFVVGDGGIITGFDEAVKGMQEGESKSVVIAPEDAYGEYSEERLLKVPHSELPEGVEVGSMLQSETPAGTAVFTVKEIDEGIAVLDGNHPLAGQTLHFEITIVNVS